MSAPTPPPPPENKRRFTFGAFFYYPPIIYVDPKTYPNGRPLTIIKYGRMYYYAYDDNRGFWSYTLDKKNLRTREDFLEIKTK